MTSFDFYFRQAGLTTFGANDPIRSIEELRTTYISGADAYLADHVSKGWEFESISNPTPNWTIRLGYSYTDRKKTNVLTEGEPWWAERVALWQQLDTLYTTRTGRPSIFNQLYVDQNNATQTRTVAARLADSDRELAQTRLEEEQGYGNRRHKANVWTRYSFASGRLRGLAVAGGWRFQSKNIAGINLATGEALYGNPRSLFDLMVQYRTRGFLRFHRDRLSVTYQLNVFNLLDDRTFFITKKDVDAVSGERFMRRGFREEPRNSSLTVRIGF
jgi:outer membrane receptor for ferric coprogen and ferric-rhodotorulic acid